MRVLMIAPPGAGKGTQGVLIAGHFVIPRIATGELLRGHVARRTNLGRAVQRRLDRGELVPDEIVLDMNRAVVEHRSDDTEVVIRQRLQMYHQVTHPIVAWYAQRGILVSVDAMRPAAEVGREILAALEVMRPLVDHVPEGLRRPVDLTGLGAAFGEVTTRTSAPG